jgi:hypothetical protein
MILRNLFMVKWVVNGVMSSLKRVHLWAAVHLASNKMTFKWHISMIIHRPTPNAADFLDSERHT